MATAADTGPKDAPDTPEGGRGVARTDSVDTAAVRELEAFLNEGAEIMAALREGPTRADLDRARMMIRTIRVGLARGGELRDRVTGLRDELVARVYDADAEVSVTELAEDAGYNTSYVSRVAARYDVPRRTVRPPRQ